jgi:hypothetical protein
MNVFRTEYLIGAEEVQGEQECLEAHSIKALRNMLEYCQARVVQLEAHHHFLADRSRQHYDLHDLCILWHRLERVQRNHFRFTERCVLIQLELARREQILEKPFTVEEAR